MKKQAIISYRTEEIIACFLVVNILKYLRELINILNYTKAISSNDIIKNED